MRIYIDSSWLLRALLRQTRMKPFPATAEAFSSALLIVECRRTLDRHLKRRLITDKVYAVASAQLQVYLDSIHLLELSPDILRRAAESFFLPIGSLDALHLATALRIAEDRDDPLLIATYDEELALVAQAHGLACLT